MIVSIYAPSRFFLDNTTTDIEDIIKKIQLDIQEMGNKNENSYLQHLE